MIGQTNEICIKGIYKIPNGDEITIISCEYNRLCYKSGNSGEMKTKSLYFAKEEGWFKNKVGMSTMSLSEIMSKPSKQKKVRVLYKLEPNDTEYQSYKFKEGVCLSANCIITKNNIIVIDEIRSDGTYYIRIQGKSDRTLVQLSDYWNILEKTDINKVYYDTLIDMPVTLKIKQSFLSELQKEFPKLESEITSLYKWIFYAKGGGATTVQEWKDWKINPETLISEKVKNGSKGKPGSYIFNRSRRSTQIANMEEWKKNFNDVLPFGIRESDFATFPEQEKIYDRLLPEFLSLVGIPFQLINYCGKSGMVSNIIPNSHTDYLTGELLNVSLFEANEHFSKEKGLELCHLDPNGGTTVNNVTIGLSKSNRIQGGQTLEEMECYGLRISILKRLKLKYGKNIPQPKILEMNNFVKLNDTDALMNILLDIY